MTSAKTRTKRVLIPTVAVVVLLGAGGVAWAATSGGGDQLSGGDRDRVSAAALEAVGGGTVTDAETSDDPGVAYEVEVRTEDGAEVDVDLDEDLAVVRQETDDRDDDGDDADDRVLTDDERTSAERAALEAVGGGTVTDVEASDDRGVAYDVEVVEDDGTEWDVDLDDDFAVVSKNVDR